MVWRETRADAVAEIIDRITAELSRGWEAPAPKLARTFHVAWLAAAADDIHRGWAARHLLDKAYSILQSDPSRSAEVEYYMQQVRTIVLRLRQSRQWSDLYRQRLHVYLLGWLGLSAMVLLARFFFQIDLENLVMWMTGVAADSWLVEHWATFVGTAGAGAFGGALGALALLVLEEVAADYTTHWQFYVGWILLAVVLFAPRGLMALRVARRPGGGNEGGRR